MDIARTMRETNNNVFIFFMISLLYYISFSDSIKQKIRLSVPMLLCRLETEIFIWEVAGTEELFKNFFQTDVFAG